jgi:hypothetical protein
MKRLLEAIAPFVKGEKNDTDDAKVKALPCTTLLRIVKQWR